MEKLYSSPGMIDLSVFPIPAEQGILMLDTRLLVTFLLLPFETGFLTTSADTTSPTGTLVFVAAPWTSLYHMTL